MKNNRISNVDVLHDVVKALNRVKRIKGEDSASGVMVRKYAEYLIVQDDECTYGNYNTALHDVMILINRLIQEDNGDVTLHEINKLQSIERSLRKPQQVVNVGELNYD